MEELIKEAENVRTKIKEYLVKHLDDFEFCNVDTHYVEYLFKVGELNYPIKIWTANGKDCAKFYDKFGGLELDYGDYTEQEKELLWNKAQDDKSQTGEKRVISKTQMRNDLYFSFEGIYGKVKFSGYDDSDWWMKYKPTEIVEDGKIVWKIDLDRMVAIYKAKD